MGSSPGSLALADVNGDGKLDVVVANEKSNDVSVLLGDDRRGFSPARGSPFRAGPNPNDIAVGDFNRDGRPDLAIANHETQDVTVLLATGEEDSRRRPAPPSASRSNPMCMASRRGTSTAMGARIS